MLWNHFQITLNSNSIKSCKIHLSKLKRSCPFKFINYQSDFNPSNGSLCKEISSIIILSLQYVHLLNWLEERIPAGQATVKTYANRADSQLKWAEHHIPKINTWLEWYYPRMDYRLPKSFLPFMYNLSLAPYFKEQNFRFTGNVQIQLSRRANYISHIYLHANGLRIGDVGVYHLNSNSTKGKALGISGYVENPVTQTLSIFTKEFIKSDNILLDIGFKGTLSDNMFGFYRSHYVDAKGNSRWV